jgi:hypothetical protein
MPAAAFLLASHAAATQLTLPLRGWAFPYRFNGTFDLYPLNTTNFNPTLDLKWQDADEQAKRGIVALDWAYCWNFPDFKKADPSCTGTSCMVANKTAAIEWFAKEAVVDRQKPGMTAAVLGRGLDECNSWNAMFADERELAAAGYRLARRRHPDTIIAGWGATSNDHVFASLMTDGTFDYAMIEGYSYCAGCGDWPASGDCCPVGPIENAVEMYADRLEFAKAQGYLNRTLFCFGFILGKSPINPFGWTRESLRAAMLKLRTGYPELAGVIMYGMPPRVGYPNATSHSTPATDQATTEMIRVAGELMLELYPTRGHRR